MKKFLFLSLLLSTIVLVSSCEKCDDNGIICTQEFRMITISLDNATQQPVVLDEAYTLRQGSTQKLLFNQSAGPGRYVVLDDSYHPQLMNDEDVFRFIGVKNNVVVVDKSFILGGDDCHVYKRSGADSAFVQP